MRRRRKSSVAKRLIITAALFLAVMALLITVALLQPDPHSGPSGIPPQPSTETNTDTEENPTDSPATSDVNRDTLQTLAQAAFAEESFGAKYMVIYDTTADVVLFEKNSSTQIVAASTIKLLTALTMLDYVGDDAIFTVGSEISMIGAGSSTAKLKKGYTLTLEQILDALLIPSGNDAAYVISAHVGRKLAKDPEITNKEAVALFLEKMNEKAKSLGAVNSSFTCPDGYPNDTQYTTASDMMKISVAAAANEKIRNTTSKVFVTYTMSDGTVLEYTNTNKIMIPSSSYHYEGLFGLKTGTTNAAGQCLIAGCDIYDHEVIIAIFKATDRFADCQAAIDTAAIAIRGAQEAARQ